MSAAKPATARGRRSRTHEGAIRAHEDFFSRPSLPTLAAQMSAEEQAWLDQQMANAEAQKATQVAPDVSAGGGHDDDDEPEPPTPTNASSGGAASGGAAAEEAGDGDYSDVMKMIEENRKKNEAKRAAQSARNAEIIAAFEQRTQAGGGAPR
jgi:hypothetical protein